MSALENLQLIETWNKYISKCLLEQLYVLCVMHFAEEMGTFVVISGAYRLLLRVSKELVFDQRSVQSFCIEKVSPTSVN